MTARTITLDDLDRVAEFDHPFMVNPDGTVADGLADIYAPTVVRVDGEREPEIEGGGWSFVDGYSGQDRYSGPVMHPSEFLGRRIARDVLADPGVYVVTEVIDLEDMDGDPIGWVLLKRDEETPADHPADCTGCDHDCAWRPGRGMYPLGAPFCGICDDHAEAVHAGYGDIPCDCGDKHEWEDEATT